MIRYCTSREFTRESLFDLFSSVGWAAAQYADRLVLAMQGSENVISAWEDDNLLGLMTAMSDGNMTVYFHWLLVRPEYQGQGVGRELVARMLANYEGYVSRILISEGTKVGFYEKLGFAKMEPAMPMRRTAP